MISDEPEEHVSLVSDSLNALIAVNLNEWRAVPVVKKRARADSSSIEKVIH